MENKLSILIPIYNEEDIILNCIHNIQNNFDKSVGDYEIIIIDDSKHNRSQEKLNIEKIKYYKNPKSKGFGNSIKEGIKRAKGEFVCIFMADQSDDPKDIIRYFEYMNSGLFYCVFGDRWTKDQNVKNYPKFKFFLNFCTPLLACEL